MKKFTLFLVLLVSGVSFGQTLDKEGVEIGRAQQFGAPVEAQLTSKDGILKISFRDSKFKTVDSYDSFTFSEADGNLDKLYQIIEKGFEEMPKDAVPITFANKTAYIKFTRLLGMKVILFTTTLTDDPNSDLVVGNLIAKKQVDKLFGKKK